MNAIELNINQMVKVKLTEEAIEMKQKQIDEFNKKFNQNLKIKIDADGYYEDQLWSIMNDFGSMLSLTSSPFVDFKILVENYK